jgi:tetratricopeptide (TPR) repeat protein
MQEPSFDRLRTSGPLGGRRGVQCAVLVAIASTLPFAGTLGHGFALDDVSEVVRNDHVRSLADMPRLFTEGAWDGAGDTNPIYRPLTSATYALQHTLGGPSPFGYHLGNVLLHGIASLLVLALGRRLGLSLAAATLGATIFAVHPLHVEVVANVAGRKDSLATALVIAAVLAHDLALRRGRAWPALAILAVAAALFAKESGAAAIGAAFAWTLLVERSPWREARARAVAVFGAYAVVFALYLLARRAAVASFGVPLSLIPYAENPLAHEDIATRLLTAIGVLGRGLGLLVFPRALSPDYSYDAIPLIRSPLDPVFLASAAVLAVIAVAAVRAVRGWPALAFCAAWFAIGVFPASNLLVKVGTVFGERLLYLPSAGFCLAAAALGVRAAQSARGRWRGARHAAPIVAAAVLLALTSRTVAYASVWRDEVSLFTEAVRTQPRSAKAHQLLGAALMEVGRIDEGVAALETADRMLSGIPETASGSRVALGVAYERQGRLDRAEQVYDEVLQRHPDQPDALWRLGVVRWGQGRQAEGARLWERAIEVDPGHARAMTDLGIAAAARGDLAGAEALWLRAAEVDPRTAGPWLYLGDVYLRRADLPRARAAWTRFLELARYGAYAGEREVVEQKLRQLDGTAARGAR